MKFKNRIDVPLDFTLDGVRYRVPIGGIVDIPRRVAYAPAWCGLPLEPVAEPGTLPVMPPEMNPLPIIPPTPPDEGTTLPVIPPPEAIRDAPTSPGRSHPPDSREEPRAKPAKK